MNDNFRKQNGKRFTRNDVQAYIMRGHLPEYLGGNEIVVTPKKHCTIKMYNVLENDNNPVVEEENECIGIQTSRSLHQAKDKVCPLFPAKQNKAPSKLEFPPVLTLLSSTSLILPPAE